MATATADGILLLPEGLTVGALVHGRIGFVGAYHDAIQRAIVGIVAVICALLYSAFNGLVCFLVHFGLLLLLSSVLVCAITEK